LCQPSIIGSALVPAVGGNFLKCDVADCTAFTIANY
jgi:hypothetical protein